MSSYQYLIIDLEHTSVGKSRCLSWSELLQYQGSASNIPKLWFQILWLNITQFISPFHRWLFLLCHPHTHWELWLPLNGKYFISSVWSPWLGLYLIEIATLANLSNHARGDCLSQCKYIYIYFFQFTNSMFGYLVCIAGWNIYINIFF